MKPLMFYELEHSFHMRWAILWLLIKLNGPNYQDICLKRHGLEAVDTSHFAYRLKNFWDYSLIVFLPSLSSLQFPFSFKLMASIF